MALALKRKPDWMQQIDWVVTRIPEPHYDIRYKGNLTQGWEEQHVAAFTDEQLDALRASGTTVLSFPYYCGFGVEFENETMDRTADCVERAHARDLRIAARVTVGAVTPETLLAEEPEAHNWLQVNADGQPCTLSGVTPGVRVRPCFQAEGYQRYIERVCLRAIESGVDLLVLQELAYNAEPNTCRCPLCVSAFRERLREWYGPQTEESRVAGLDRFGHHIFNHLRPPLYRPEAADLPAQLAAPHEQEWQWFKSQTLARFLGRLSKAIERQNAECGISADVLCPSEREARIAGIDYAQLLPLLDLAALRCNGEYPDSEAQAHLVKRAQTFGVSVCLPNQPDSAAKAQIAVLAQQPNGPLHVGPADEALIGFRRQHREALFADARAVAPIGVYCDTTSLVLSDAAPHAGLASVERILTQRHLPFALLVPGQLEELSGYACVVVAESECLSDAAGEHLRNYAESGGALLVTGRSGAYDVWRRQRATPLWSDLFGERDGAVQMSLGQGRAAYVPQVEDETALNDGIRFAIGEAAVRVAAHDGQFRLAHYRLGSGAQTLHIVRATDTPAVALEFALDIAAAPKEVRLYAPGSEPRSIAHSYDSTAQQLSFSLNELPEYAVVRIA